MLFLRVRNHPHPLLQKQIKAHLEPSGRCWLIRVQSLSLENSLHKITLNRVQNQAAFPFSFYNMYFTECILISLKTFFSFISQSLSDRNSFLCREMRLLFHCFYSLDDMKYSTTTNLQIMLCQFLVCVCQFRHLCQIVKCMPQIMLIPQSTSFIVLLNGNVLEIFLLALFFLPESFWMTRNWMFFAWPVPHVLQYFQLQS